MNPQDAELGLDVSRETVAALEAFRAALLKWSPKINLVSRSTLGDAWGRHIVDSVQLITCATDSFETWCDIGPGGGLPAIPLATIALERKPEARFVLIESDARKAAFLKMQADALSLHARVVRSRIETAVPAQADIVSARALAPLPELLAYVDRHLTKGGLAILPKGRVWQDEIALARRTWHFQLDLQDSKTDPDGKILMIRDLRRLEPET